MLNRLCKSLLTIYCLFLKLWVNEVALFGGGNCPGIDPVLVSSIQSGIGC